MRWDGLVAESMCWPGYYSENNALSGSILQVGTLAQLRIQDGAVCGKINIDIPSSHYLINLQGRGTRLFSLFQLKRNIILEVDFGLAIILARKLSISVEFNFLFLCLNENQLGLSCFIYIMDWTDCIDSTQPRLEN